MTLWFSAVTTTPVFFAEDRMVSRSMGFTVWTLTTSQLIPSAASSSAAFNDSLTIRHAAKTVTSVPVRRRSALNRSKAYPSEKTVGNSFRFMRI